MFDIRPAGCSGTTDCSNGGKSIVATVNQSYSDITSLRPPTPEPTAPGPLSHRESCQNLRHNSEFPREAANESSSKPFRQPTVPPAPRLTDDTCRLVHRRAWDLKTPSQSRPASPTGVVIPPKPARDTADHGCPSTFPASEFPRRSPRRVILGNGLVGPT